ncbi:MAG: efflux RND transporter periplasmic adaptor subunit [Gemmatimonadales bacterium]|nr:MAG: efflux RND transporter periplasmic adaptor subunit [Gemmatimonadales bacterium]
MITKTLRLALLAGVVAACNTSEAVEAPSLETATLDRGDLRITVEATGTVEPIREVEVKSKASGEIQRLHVDVGDQVEPGTLLAEVDPRDVRNGYEQAQADLQVAEARAEISEQQLQRQRELLAAGVITQQELESAALDAANAQANLVKARTNFELAELRLADVTIRAPLAGTILQRNVEEGTVIQSASQNVSGGSVLFVMAELAAMQVRTLVDETDMGQLAAGMSSSVTVEAYPERTFRGVVEKIEPQAVVQQNVTMFPVIVTLDNRSGLLRPGMNAEVEVLVDEATDVLLVPNGAIVNLQDVGPAALALGLDLDEIDLMQFRRGRPGAAEGAQGAPGGQQASPEQAPAEAAPPSGAPSPTAAMDSLRARVARGELSQDSMRALVRARMQEQGGGFVRPQSGALQPGAGVPPRDVRRAAVFVLIDGVPEVRMIQIGLNDWDNTQVVSGLEGDEVLAVIGAAQLQARQQEFLDRIRSRTGGSPFGSGMGRR